MKEPVKNGKVQCKYEEIHIANTNTMPHYWDHKHHHTNYP